MAVLPNQTLRLTPAQSEPLTSDLDLVWNHRDAEGNESELRICLDFTNERIHVRDSLGQLDTALELPSHCITRDTQTATISVDLPGWIHATIDASTGRCLYARSPVLAKLGGNSGRSRAVRGTKPSEH